MLVEANVQHITANMGGFDNISLAYDAARLLLTCVRHRCAVLHGVTGAGWLARSAGTATVPHHDWEDASSCQLS